MNRKVCQLSENIQNLLRKQAAHELRNFNLYNSFANYFSLEGLVDLQEYYLKREIYLKGVEKRKKKQK